VNWTESVLKQNKAPFQAVSCKWLLRITCMR